jgi:hypothetical protein
MDAVRATRITALGVVALAVARVPHFELHHARPALGAEASALQRAMFYHWGLHDHLGWTWWDQMLRDAFMPPLWYGGVPLLGAGSTTMDLALVLAVNAFLLAILAGGVWRLAEAMAPETGFAGPFAAVILVGLPGIAGRITVAGVEPLHAALLILWLLALRRLRTKGFLVAGLVLGAGFLAKWNFAAYALGPWIWEAWAARRDRGRGSRLVLAGLIGLACFAGWWWTAADSAVVLAGAGDEPTFPGDLVGAALFYPRHLARYLGWGAAILIVGAAASHRRGPQRPDRTDVGLLLMGSASVVLPHLFIPHQEARYLLPALAPLAVLLAFPVARAAAGLARVPRGLAAIVLAPAAATLLAASAPLSVDFAIEELRLRPDPDDYGLDIVTRHPTLARRERNVITYSIPQRPAAPILTALDWAFYSRNDLPALGRGNHLDFTERAAAFDLERSTHVVTARDLPDQERAVLASMGFSVAVAAAPVTLPDFPPLTLWVLDPTLEPPMRGPGPSPP